MELAYKKDIEYYINQNGRLLINKYNKNSVF